MDEPTTQQNKPAEKGWNLVYLAVVFSTLVVFGALWWFSQLFI